MAAENEIENGENMASAASAPSGGINGESGESAAWPAVKRKRSIGKPGVSEMAA